MLAHNGEINTLLGNINWMKAHECRLDHPSFGTQIEDLKPIIQPGGSDSASGRVKEGLFSSRHRDLE